MRWLITGGCGFIGSALISSLGKEQGHSIRVLDNFSVATPKNLSQRLGGNHFSIKNSDECAAIPDVGANEKNLIEIVNGDITNEKSLQKITENAEVIVHLAANTGVEPSVKNPHFDMRTNVEGTLNLLIAARHNDVRRFVFASSGAPLGEVVPPIHEEMSPHPVSPYGASKLAGEGYCSAFFHTFGVDTVTLRFSNVYGPGSAHKNSVVSKFITHFLRDEEIVIYGDGNQTRDFIFIDDLVDAIRNAVTKSGVAGETFQIATNKETSLNELVRLLENSLSDVSGAKIKVKKCKPRLGDVFRNYSDTSKARNQLGWQPKTTLEDGLSKTLRWFQEYQ